MKSKKLGVSIILCVLLTVALVGCGDIIYSYTYSIGTGDIVKVSVSNTAGYTIEDQDNSFNLMKDGELQASFIFVEESIHDMYYEAAYESEGATIIEEGSRDDCTYLFYSYNDTEWDYIIWLTDSNTGVILATGGSQEIAEECFAQMTFEVE